MVCLGGPCPSIHFQRPTFICQTSLLIPTHQNSKLNPVVNGKKKTHNKATNNFFEIRVKNNAEFWNQLRTPKSAHLNKRAMLDLKRSPEFSVHKLWKTLPVITPTLNPN